MAFQKRIGRALSESKNEDLSRYRHLFLPKGMDYRFQNRGPDTCPGDGMLCLWRASYSKHRLLLTDSQSGNLSA